ncbi:MAG: nucleotidyltransferase domain-containing protein [Candidatus Sumerlaeota bacterium]|nr:nucleotidyltransferase domain-containing protein [Candidatus Sumerlaeota bacterium]
MKTIRGFAKRVGKEFNPHKIILFGSYAYGKPNEDSDVDLLIILPFEGRPVEQSVAIQMKCRPHFPVDIIVRTPEKIQERLSIEDGFIKEILDKGRVLYETTDAGMDRESGRGFRDVGKRNARSKRPKL